MSDKVSFQDALKKLGIEKYGDRILSSNSHGELMHLYDYIVLANYFDEPYWFAEWFGGVVKSAEKNWDRPESVFQHIPKILKNDIYMLKAREENE